jgi:hypothetical protein
MPAVFLHLGSIDSLYEGFPEHGLSSFIFPQFWSLNEKGHVIEGLALDKIATRHHAPLLWVKTSMDL